MATGRKPGAKGSVRGKAVALLFITAFFTAAALAHVWVRLQVVRLGYSISRQTEREKQLQQVHRKLQVEQALLRNPERLERLARERLNLTMPDPTAIQALGKRIRAKRNRTRARVRTRSHGSGVHRQLAAKGGAQ